jgi:hypothetical protein
MFSRQHYPSIKAKISSPHKAVLRGIESRPALVWWATALMANTLLQRLLNRQQGYYGNGFIVVIPNLGLVFFTSTDTTDISYMFIIQLAF